MNAKKTLNIPNTLSLIRVLLVPVFVATLIYMRDMWLWGQLVPAFIFGVTALTDTFDGLIARKYNMITDFGKFIDPLADKFMVFAALISIIYRNTLLNIEHSDLFSNIFLWVSIIVIFRELAITSIRLVIAGKSGKVVAASWWGKIKTFTQCIAIALIILNPIIAEYDHFIISYVATAAILITTIGSGVDYFKVYLPLIDTNN